MVCERTPGSNVSVPDGNTPPTKSAPLAAEVPEPVTAKSTVADWLVSPERVTVKVNGVEPVLPSALAALVAETLTELPVEVTIDPVMVYCPMLA